jgi:uncharacterized DUF497 family protein
MKPLKAVDLLHHCLEDGEIVPTKHFRDELCNECILFEDAWSVLRYGQIYEPAEEDTRSGEYKYRIQGYEPGGKWMVIVFSFKSLDRACLITIFSVRAKGKRK